MPCSPHASRLTHRTTFKVIDLAIRNVNVLDGSGAPAFEAAQVVVNGADHFDVIDPTHPSWDVVLDELARVLGS